MSNESPSSLALSRALDQTSWNLRKVSEALLRELGYAQLNTELVAPLLEAVVKLARVVAELENTKMKNIEFLRQELDNQLRSAGEFEELLTVGAQDDQQP